MVRAFVTTLLVSLCLLTMGCTRAPSVNQGRLEGTVWRCKAGTPYRGKIMPELTFDIRTGGNFVLTAPDQVYDGTITWGADNAVTLNFNQDFFGTRSSREELWVYGETQLSFRDQDGRELVFRRLSRPFTPSSSQKKSAEDLAVGRFAQPPSAAGPVTYFHSEVVAEENPLVATASDAADAEWLLARNNDREGLTVLMDGMRLQVVSAKGSKLTPGRYTVPQLRSEEGRIDPVMQSREEAQFSVDLPMLNRGGRLRFEYGEIQIWELEIANAQPSRVAVDIHIPRRSEPESKPMRACVKLRYRSTFE